MEVKIAVGTKKEVGGKKKLKVEKVFGRKNKLEVKKK